VCETPKGEMKGIEMTEFTKQVCLHSTIYYYCLWSGQLEIINCVGSYKVILEWMFLKNLAQDVSLYPLGDNMKK